ncbi:hypothetical protein DY000_02063576 [Brassica cretica]|uniref:UBX domain-containing protein n=1 Tax=Brassica cretica TaxID=69181 RepID=A0ABQ7AWQ9_BRACR|nr:hypothetical protein DY000_02063576 [Brassica cretica]
MTTEMNENLITSFLEITSSSREEAAFFLESHHWDLDAAVSTFLDNDATSAAAANDLPAGPNPSLPPPLIPAASPHSPSENQGAGNPSGSIRTLADLNLSPADGADSDTDERQEYYTGGQRSGMMVQDPKKPKDVDALSEQARLSTVDIPVESSRRSASTSASGMLSGEPVPSAPQQPQEQQQDKLQSVMHTITFWRNGFTVDDGPLRRFEDPENVTFMESIARSECPCELEPVDRKNSVRVRVRVELVRREDNNIEPPKPKNSSQGVERILGAGSAAAEVQAPPAQLNTAPVPSVGLVVDQAAPTTSIQLRLADGTRLVSRFNNHHTVREVYGFVDASTPGGSRGYQLLTMAFPHKQLTDLDQTIEQAGIANSVVIQKF